MKKIICILSFSIVLLNIFLAAVPKETTYGAFSAGISLTPSTTVCNVGDQVTVTYAVTGTSTFEFFADVSCSDGLSASVSKILDADVTGGGIRGSFIVTANSEGDQTVSLLNALAVSSKEQNEEGKCLEQALSASITIHVRTTAEIQAIQEEAARKQREAEAAAQKQREAEEAARKQREAEEAARKQQEAEEASKKAAEASKKAATESNTKETTVSPDETTDPEETEAEENILEETEEQEKAFESSEKSTDKKNGSKESKSSDPESEEDKTLSETENEETPENNDITANHVSSDNENLWKNICSGFYSLFCVHLPCIITALILFLLSLFLLIRNIVLRKKIRNLRKELEAFSGVLIETERISLTETPEKAEEPVGETLTAAKETSFEKETPAAAKEIVSDLKEQEEKAEEPQQNETENEEKES